MKRIKIVTHSGRAHRDELLAIALLAVKENVPPEQLDIYRVSNCKAEDFDGAFVIDIGGQHRPDMLWFDHHQFSPDHAPACALTLIADHYGVKMSDHPWMFRVAVLDSKGLIWWFNNKFNRQPVSMREAVAELDDKTSIFSYIEHLANADKYTDAVKLAYEWMKNEVDYIESVGANAIEGRNSIKIVDLGNGYKMAYFDRMQLPPGTMIAVDEAVALDPTIIVTGKLDERNDGYSAMRLMDHPKVNFTPRSGEEGCVFAHANGFCLKWKKDWDSYVSAVARSISK